MEKLEKLTKEKALEEVGSIKRISGDDECAHGYEDSLRAWFISCAAKGMYSKKELIEVAKIVESTSEIKFARWCA